MSKLEVTREAGQRKCVLTGGKVGETVTTLDPQMMADYLHLVYPGQIVTWRVLPTENQHKEVAA